MAPDRYTRHRDLLSPSAWQRLSTLTVVIAGVGGLGSHVLSSLARLGPLKLDLWDPGILDEPDLNRQVLYSPSDLGTRKVERARDRLTRVNPDLKVSIHAEPITAKAFISSFKPPKSEQPKSSPEIAVFDCLDSFGARAELETIRKQLAAVIFHAGVEAWYGQITTFLPGGPGYPSVFGPDFASLPKAPKPIFSHTVQVAAGFQVGEFVHWCENQSHTPLSDNLLLYDGRLMQIERLKLAAS